MLRTNALRDTVDESTGDPHTPLGGVRIFVVSPAEFEGHALRGPTFLDNPAGGR